MHDRPPRVCRGITVILGCLILLGFGAPAACGSSIKADERVVFYPALFTRGHGTNVWECEIQGVVFEAEQRRIPLAILRAALTIHHEKLSPDEEAIFTERGRLFMVDNERRRDVSIRIGDQVFAIGRTGPNGHFSGQIKVETALIERIRKGQSVPYDAALAAGDTRVFSGAAILPRENGITIISDIDDTIKISNVRERKKLLANTFYRPFVPVPGMAGLYQRWERELQADVSYVSASPWQLFEPLSQFVATNGFPAGAFYLKQFRVKDRSFFNLFESPMQYKLAVIEPMMKKWPERRFILIGDSGEKDPETYGIIARRYPDRIEHIYIRDATGEPAEAERYRKAFHGLPGSIWQVFKDPGELR